MKTVLEETFEKLQGYVEDYNKALLAKSLEGKTEAETNIKGALKDYRKQKFDSVLYALKQEDDPMMAAVKMFTYPVFRAKVVREDGIETGIELVPQDVRIDLVRVAEYCDISSVWKYKVEKLGLLLALRAAKNMGLDAGKLKTMTNDYRMHDLARKEEMGETPSSNTQIVKLIQTILDEVLPDSGKKANSHDAAYMWMASTRAGRAAQTIKVCDGRLALNLFADVANRIVTDGKYDAEYRKVSRTEKSDAPKQEEPAAEEVAEEPEEVLEEDLEIDEIELPEIPADDDESVA